MSYNYCAECEAKLDQAIKERDLAVKALEELKTEAECLYNTDNQLFLTCKKENYPDLSQYSRHLQTFSWIRDQCDHTLQKIGGEK